MRIAPLQTPPTTTSTVAEHYNTRAASYDAHSSFHRRLATEFVFYASARPGETLLDIACGTGLVTLEFARVLQSQGKQPVVIGIDISSGMLDVARGKLASAAAAASTLEVLFLEYDAAADLSRLEGLRGREGSFDIITVCSALVLFSSPGQVLKNWAVYLKKGGRVVVDVPGITSMLGLKIFSMIAPEFGIQMMGDQLWVQGPESLRSIMEAAGLDVVIEETDIWDDIPSRTDNGIGVWTDEEGGRVFDEAGWVGGFRQLKDEEIRKARGRFMEEWEKLADDEGMVREQNRLYVGIGRKQD